MLTGDDWVEIPRLCDFHAHLREGELLAYVVAHTPKVFDWVLLMPNLKRPIRTAEDMCRYRDEVLAADPPFRPLFTIYLCEDTTPRMIEEARKAGAVAAKLYFRGVTTNSTHGVGIATLKDLAPTFLAMQACGMRLCVHAELPGAGPMDAESACMPYVTRLARAYPGLQIVVEHMTTAVAVRDVMEHENMWGTITLHHLLLTFEDVLGNHDHFCKPVAKTWGDRDELVLAAICDHPRIGFGSDNAPHLIESKSRPQGPAGIASWRVAAPLLVEIFDGRRMIDRLDPFTHRLCKLYGVEPTEETIRLERRSWTVPVETDPCGVQPFFAGREISWQLVNT